MKKQVLIIGAGASGMTAAIFAARSGASVALLEHMDKAGKKILATGNGRCNLSNRVQASTCYRCEQPGFPEKVLKQFPVNDTLEFFQELGILPKDRNGYLYPNSDQASSVLEVLKQELKRQKVRLVLNCDTNRIMKKDSLFVVQTNQGEFCTDSVILATGSKAAPVTGSDGSGYKLAEALGHRIVTPLPALVQLRCQEKHYKQLAGVRTEAKVELLVSGRRAAEELGELQLTDYGISGIPVFQVSRYAAVALYHGRRVTAVLDFLPQMEYEAAGRMLKERRKRRKGDTCEAWMTGLLNKKLCLVLLKLSSIGPEERVEAVDEERWNRLLKNLKAYKTTVVSTNSYENAQVCCGGVDTREVEGKTLESKKVRGLYFAGELLDVDGICGGYNLQWAWSSGMTAGCHAAIG